MPEPILLLIHDDAALREQARDLASSLGCRLVIAATPEEGSLRLAGAVPDIVVTTAADAGRAGTGPLALFAGPESEWPAFMAGACCLVSQPLALPEWEDLAALARDPAALEALTRGAAKARSGGGVEMLRALSTLAPASLAAAWAQYLGTLVLLSGGKLQEALEELSSLADDHPAFWRAHERLAGIWKAAGDDATAQAHRKQVSATKEDHASRTARAREQAATATTPVLPLDALDTQPDLPAYAQGARPAVVAPAPPPPAASRAEPARPSAPTGSSILVADDSELIREMIAEALTEAGYRVRTAADGKTALDLARHERPDLLILDGLMPGIHGFEVCKAVKEQLYPRNPPKVVILSAIYTKQRQRSEAVSIYKADEVLAKPVSGPFQGSDLIAVVRRHLGA